jgi:alpha-glucosidase (family GH31 glycosyl hydrolase)
MDRWRTTAILGFLLSAPLLAGSDCNGGTLGEFPPPTFTNALGTVSVTVATDPFALVVKAADGTVLLESTTPHSGTAPEASANEVSAYAPLAITHDTNESQPGFIVGWDYFRGVDAPWQFAGRVSSIDPGQDPLVLHVATTDPLHPSLTVSLSSQGIGFHLVILVDNPGDPSDSTYQNRVSLGFVMHDDPAEGSGLGTGDHFLGTGERFCYTDHRGQFLTNYVDEGGLGSPESDPIGPHNPPPDGPSQTYMPVPWMLSPRGFGMLMNTTWRTNFHLGEELPGTWRVEATQPRLDMTLFVDKDPLNLVEALTGVTGRPPAIADFVIAPRRRGDVGTDANGNPFVEQAAMLRAANIPTATIDTAMHYFPDGPAFTPGPDMQALTKLIHDQGFRAITYFNSWIADSWQPVYDEAVANGYLVKNTKGEPYVMLDEPYTAGIVDFTNPAALAWYQGWLKSALDDGWDGWMYDFGEYVAQDAVFYNGMNGEQAHNLYPIMMQKAANAVLEKEKPGDYLIFVRAGYTGSSGLVPDMWAGDQSTDFGMGNGLPAALVGALNVGMSGMPIWGSDISGYHFVSNPPPDKELYLRWTEVGGFSGDMHDENEGAGPPGSTSSERWQIWDDQESEDTYRKYASYKMRMIPYVRVAVNEARARGTPIMRHLYLLYPTDPNVYTIGDEYMYGDSLLVAPVVHRGLTSRPVYLPASDYYDYWSGERVHGKTMVTAEATLDDVPVYALEGGIVPLLSPDVQSLLPAADGSVVTMADRAGYLEVQVFAGGTTKMTLDDGTVLEQSAPTTSFDPGPATLNGRKPIPAASSQADLTTCGACTWDDPASHVWSVAVHTADDTITAGPLTLAVHSSPSVKQFVFTVRH